VLVVKQGVKRKEMKHKFAKRVAVALAVAVPVWAVLVVSLFVLHAVFYSNISDLRDAWMLVGLNTFLLVKRTVLLSLIFSAALVIMGGRS
jgi:hypothetical protein